MFGLNRQLLGETKLFMGEFIFRLQISWKRRRWLNHREYLEVLMDESKRGN